MITKNYYPDETFYPVIDSFVNHITFRINSYNDLWFLKQIKDVYDYNGEDLSVTIPFLIDAQADRRFNSNSSSSLKDVCEFINSMKFKGVKVFHPHNPEVVEALLNNVKIIDNSKFIKDVIADLKNEVVLMSTDAGGFKPLMKLADKLNWKGEVYSASKSRSWNETEHKSELIQQLDKTDFGGKDILIIDDLCVKGGTFLGLASLLKERNVGKLFLAVSHITVKDPNPALGEVFDRIYTTNSKFDKYNLNNLTVFQNFQVNG